MFREKHQLRKEDLDMVDRYILRQGGTPAWRTVQKNLIERCIGTIGKPLADVVDDDILKARDMILQSTYRPNYQRQLIKALRNFFIWYGKQTNADFSDIEGIKLPKGQWKTKNPGDMLSAQDVERILRSCKNSRDRCFVAMLWDGSNRAIELLSLSWKDIQTDSYGYFFTTSAKTGKERHIRLTISIPYLEDWKRNYPGVPSGDSPVFVTVYKVKGEYPRWGRDAAQALMKELRRETGIKTLKLSLFRPSRITHDVKSGYDLPYIMKKNWGSLKTNMIDLYTNIDADYVDQIALRKAGMSRIEQAKEQVYQLEPPTCPSCKTLNILGSPFCSTCRLPLTDAAKMQQERERNIIMDKIMERLGAAGKL